MKLYLLIVTQFIFLSGISQEKKVHVNVIPGPGINFGYNETFSAGLGFELCISKASPAGRAGHWRMHNFLLDYDWNYFFQEDFHLSEDLGLTCFYSYIGLFKSPWQL